MDIKTTTRLLAVLGITISIGFTLYIAPNESIKDHLISVLFIAAWSSVPYIFSMRIGTVKGRYIISNVLLCTGILLSIILYIMFHKAGTSLWAPILVPIYQFIALLVLYALMHLSSKNKYQGSQNLRENEWDI